MEFKKAPILTDEESRDGFDEYYWDDMPEGTSRHDWAHRAAQRDADHKYYTKKLQPSEDKNWVMAEYGHCFNPVNSTPEAKIRVVLENFEDTY